MACAKRGEERVLEIFIALHVKVQRILPDREGCERVTKLTGRSLLGVG